MYIHFYDAKKSESAILRLLYAVTSKLPSTLSYLPGARVWIFQLLPLPSVPLPLIRVALIPAYHQPPT